MDPLADQVIGMLAKRKKVAPESITAATSFEELSLDSLDQLEMMFDFEETFDIRISDETIHEMKTVGDVIAALRTALASDVAPAS